MLIEKLRCESICLLGSHYAMLSVNITPEENLQREVLMLALSLSLLLSLSCDDDTIQQRKKKSRLCSCALEICLFF